MSSDKTQRAKPKAHVRALAWLSRREHSELELRHRLAREGYADEEIQDALRWLTSNNWQSDTRFASSLARRRASTYGSRRIQAELKQHHVSVDVIETAIDDLDSPEHERAARWLERRCTGRVFTPENRAKWYRALLARGFTPDSIKKAFAIFNESAPNQADDTVADFE